jgi:LuxR family transcriptional regulator, maltose regulon positive regulatory protein
MMRNEAVDLLKFTPPSLPGWFVHRSRLSRQVAEGLTKRLMLLEAPAGYGKTSLLASVAHQWDSYSGQSGLKHLAWLQLEISDNDPAVFLEGLVSAFRGPIPGFGLPTLLALRSVADPARRIDHLIGVFLDDLARTGERDMALVLDDFHLLTNRDLLTAIDRRFVVGDCPFRLVVSSRSDPPMYLGTLRTRGDLAELDSDDLRFSHEEVRELLQRRVGSNVAEEVVSAVYRETRGWPSFAAMAALLAAHSGGAVFRANLAPTEHGHARMVSEVVRLLPREKQAALLRSSLMPFLDDAACANERVMGKANGILGFIRQEGLPVTSPASSASPLRYDALFRSALEDELRHTLSAEEYRALQREAAVYCEARGEWDEAISRYLRAGEGEAAASLVERAAEFELEMGHTETVFRWIRSLPVAARRSHPRLTVDEGKLLLARGILDEARATLASAKAELVARGDLEGEAERLGAWALLLFREGNPEQARETVADALATLPDRGGATAGDLFLLLSGILEAAGDLQPAYSAASEALLIAEKIGRWNQVVDAMVQLARLAHSQGRTDETLAISARGIQRACRSGTELLSISHIGGIAATAYLDRGDIQEAGMVAGKSLEIARQTQDYAGQIRALLAQAAVQDRLGELQPAQDSLEEAVRLTSKLPVCAPERALTTRAEAAFLLRRGDRRKGVKKAREAARAAAQCRNTVLAEESRLVAAAGDLAGITGRVNTLPGLLRLAEAFRRQGNARWHSAALALAAVAYLQLGVGRAARESLERSLAHASREGYIGLPFGLPARRDRLLALAVREDLAPSVAARFLDITAEDAEKSLAPLLQDKKLEIRTRAEALLSSLYVGSSRMPVRIIWPGLPDWTRDASPSVHLHTLGEFIPRIGDVETEWPSRDARSLAAYLLVNRGQVASREQVMDALWPGADPAAANLQLQVALYQLGESLGSGYARVELDVEEIGSYRWDGAGCLADIDAFLNGIERAHKLWPSEQPPVLSEEMEQSLEKAVNLYDGEFMSALEYEWCVPLREELKGHLLWATRVLVSHYVAQRRWGEVLRTGLKSLRSDPLQEDIVRNVMLAHYRLGDRDAVLQDYRELKRVLARERSAWPSEETRQLRMRLLGR